jgi:hypothetical protein
MVFASSGEVAAHHREGESAGVAGLDASQMTWGPVAVGAVRTCIQGPPSEVRACEANV